MHVRAAFLGFTLASLAAVSFAACSGNTGLPFDDAGAKPDVTTQPDVVQTVDAGKDSPADAPPTDAPGFIWPDCKSQPNTAPTKTISDVWNDNPSQPTEVWIPGVYVTAISQGACTAGTACEFFLQQDLTYPDLATGAHHGIREWVTAATATHFTTLAVDQQVDVYAWAYRDTSQGQDELILHVDTINPGCVRQVGTGTATPIAAQLTDLDQLVDYEQTYGPLLVQIANVTGTPKQPGQTFGLGDTFFDGGSSGGQIISLSPYFLPGGVFTGLTTGLKTKFASVTGVYGLFVPPTDASVTKYLEIYPRTMADVVQ